MTTEEKLDETDIRILKLLQQNSRLTVKELAAKYTSPLLPPLSDKKRLEREGIHPAIWSHQVRPFTSWGTT